MLRLPVSGLDVALRMPDGADDMLLHEASGAPVDTGLALLARLARGNDGRADWSGLTVTDFEVLLLHVRTARLGERLALGFACPHCRARVEIGFRIADYLHAVRPRTVPGVVPDDTRPGWFTLQGAGFRLPTAADQAEAARHADPACHLAAACLDKAARTRPMRGRVERAMAAMAPEVSRPIGGTCPDCAAAVLAPLHVTRLVFTELRRAAATVHDEVNLIARAYHWPEATILALPQGRRRAYAERIRATRAQAA